VAEADGVGHTVWFEKGSCKQGFVVLNADFGQESESGEEEKQTSDPNR
jgi:hypothetical protein